MKFVFFVFIGILLIVVRTSVLPLLMSTFRFYDPTVPFIIYLGIHRPLREGIPVMLILGVVMDSLSGAPFGLYILSYGWIYIGVKYIVRVLKLEHGFVVATTVLLGVFVENLLFMLNTGMRNAGLAFGKQGFIIVLTECTWAFITGAWFVKSFRYAHYAWFERFHRKFIRKKGNVE